MKKLSTYLFLSIGGILLTSYSFSGELSVAFIPQDSIQTTGSYQISIQRTYTRTKQAQLIQKLEAFNPPQIDVLTSAHILNPYLTSDTATSFQWWNNSFEDIHAPYAITKEALQYYVNLVKSFKNNNYSMANGTKFIGAHLYYSAKASDYHDYEYKSTKYVNVTLVSLKLQWWQYRIGNPATFTRERFALFDQQGRMIRIWGDGENNYFYVYD